MSDDHTEEAANLENEVIEAIGTLVRDYGYSYEDIEQLVRPKSLPRLEDHD